MNTPVAPELVRTYKVKLAYGRDMFGTRALVRHADGREEDMQNSEYLRLVRAAAPRDQNRFYPTLKVGQLVLARDVNAQARVSDIAGVVTRVCKGSFFVAARSLDGALSAPVSCKDVLWTYASENLFNAALEAAAPTVEALRCKRDCVWAEYMNTRPDLGAERPAHVQAATDAYQAVRVAITAKYGLDYQQADSLFGF